MALLVALLLQRIPVTTPRSRGFKLTVTLCLNAVLYVYAPGDAASLVYRLIFSGFQYHLELGRKL